MPLISFDKIDVGETVSDKDQNMKYSATKTGKNEVSILIFKPGNEEKVLEVEKDLAKKIDKIKFIDESFWNITLDGNRVESIDKTKEYNLKETSGVKGFCILKLETQ